MIVITIKGFYFIGKAKDLPFNLKLLGNKDALLKSIINKNLQ